MDALWKSFAVILAVVAVVSVVPVIADDADAAGELDGLLIYEVNPFTNEGVSLYNYGNTKVDLRDYTITDNPAADGGKEGMITFSESIIIPAGQYIVIATDPDSEDDFTSRDDVSVYYTGQDGIVKTNFALSNSGDDVYLWHHGEIIDAVCYDNIVIEDSTLWTGDSVSTSNEIIQRHGESDTDSADDWKIYVPGWTYNEFDPSIKFDATVTPFLFPDSGGIPIYQALDTAQESIYINVYLITSKNICAFLRDIITERDVNLNILIEGTPVDGSIEAYIPSLMTLVEEGADIRMIGVGNDARFVQDHAKYAIIDMETVVVTSENWTTENLNGNIDDDVYKGTTDGNRGWGAVIESEEYAYYMYSVFMNDFSKDYGDVVSIQDAFPNARPANLFLEEPEDATFTSYSAQVTPILSNDNSYEYTEYFINAAEERIYCEQQSLSSVYQDPSNESPLATLSIKANEGVDARLLIGTGVTNYNNVEYTINASTQIKAGTLTTPYVHNKGIVSDDVAIVSSVNWTPASMNTNRECAVAIYSPEIADFFAQAFLNDFNECYDYDGFRIDITEIQSSYPAGEEITFGVTVTPSGSYKYLWDFGDGTEPIETKIPRVPHTPALIGDAEAFVLTVTVIDTESGDTNTVSKSYTVGTTGPMEPSEPSEPDEPIEPGEPSEPSDPGEPSEPSNPTETEDDVTVDALSEYGYLIIPIIVIILAIAGAISRSGKKKSTNRRK